ncbi:MAG: metallophosphoesterase [Myxococcaceae bacterium]
MPYPLRLLLFFLLVTVVLGGGHLYLYRRLFLDTGASVRVRRLGAVALGFLGLSLLFARLISTRLHSQGGNLLALFAWCWLGLALYLGPVLALTRLATRLAEGWRRRHDAAPLRPERRAFLARAAVGGAAAIAAGAGSYGLWRAFQPPLLREVAVRLPGLPRTLDGFRIVQMSDVHLGDVLGRPFLEELVRRCNALRPDLVAVTGDLVDGTVQHLGPTVSALSGLRSREGTFFVMGNHEYYAGDREWAEALSGMGIQVLRNRYLTLGDAGGRLDVVGVDDYGQRDVPNGRGYDLEAALAGRDAGRAAVLLAHQPRGVEAALDRGIGLQLSGHTHGGQLFPITLVVDAAYRYSAGLYPVGEGHVYVSRGTGFWGPPMRIGSPSEITSVTLLA